MTNRDYSGTPLAKKLGIQPGARVAVIDAPEGFELALGPLAEGAVVVDLVVAPLDVIVLFTTERRHLEQHFGALRAGLHPSGGLWVAWPKRASKLATDLSFDIVQGTGLAAGLVDNKSCAIDADWQALRFVVRLKDRPRK